MRFGSTSLFAILVSVLGCSTSSTSDVCAPDDLDGIVGGEWTFELVVDDAGFAPLILKTQNSSTVTLSLENRGTRAHGFHIDCLPTPNEDGCPLESCFAPEANIASLDAGSSATTTFPTPRVEGIYTFRSSLPGDEALNGQFVVQ